MLEILDIIEDILRHYWLQLFLWLHFFVMIKAWSYLNQDSNSQEKDKYIPPSKENFNLMMKRGDPLADEVMRVQRKHPKMIVDPIKFCEIAASEGTVEEKTIFEDFLKQINYVPEWVDKRKIQVARETYLRLGFAVKISGFAAILESYGYTPGVTVLYHTGRLASKSDIKRRLYETSQFVNDIVIYGPFPGQKGHSSAVSVRLLHSAVRKFVLKSGKWNVEENGYPANQEDMLHTIILFSHVHIRGLEKIGAILSPYEKECWNHLWRYVGYVMGLEDGLFPVCYEREITLYKAILEHQFHPNEESIRITKANISALSSFLFPESLTNSLARFLLENAEIPNMPELLHIEKYSSFHERIITWSCILFKYSQIWQVGFYPLRISSIFINKILLNSLTYIAMGFERANFMFKTSNET